MTDPRKKLAKRDRILEATIRFFSTTHNFSKVSIEDIAKEAGVSPTTIYNNFGTRDRLLADVIKEITIRSIAEYRAIIQSDIPYPEKIRQVMQRKFDFAGGLDWNTINRLISQDKELAAFAGDIQAGENQAILTELIADGKNQGYISRDTSDEAILLYFRILQASGSAFFDIVRSGKTDSRTIEQINDIMFFGLLERKDQ